MFAKSAASFVAVAVLVSAMVAGAQEAKPTYAERLGWKADDRVVIFHADDAGMCHSANAGIQEALEYGILTSTSTMMPCSWVSEFAKYLKAHPEVDNGLHLTFTSEFGGYRWGPLAGKYLVPSMVDAEGCFWPEAEDVARNAKAEELEIELRAQVDRAQAMGIPITHLDSHMGTVFQTEGFFQAYMKVGIEKQIPIMVPAGHGTLIMEAMPRLGENGDGMRMAGELIWQSGLPVIDDLSIDTGDKKTPEQERDYITGLLRGLKPGITQIILHSTRPTDEFRFISSTGDMRLSELLVMLDPEVKKVIEEEGIILTTWRELKERRDKVGK